LRLFDPNLRAGESIPSLPRDHHEPTITSGSLVITSAALTILFLADWCFRSSGKTH
jgi:hypothetical protein